MGFRGVRLSSLWVLIARNPGEIQGRVWKWKVRVAPPLFVCQVWRLLNEWFTRTGGAGPILHEAIFAERCNFQTRILIKFLSVLSFKFHQSRSNLSF